MATCDQTSDLIYRLRAQQIGSDVLIPTLPANRKEDLFVRSLQQGRELGDIFYFIEPRVRNPWAAIGSLSFLAVVLLSLVAIPFFHTDALPTRETLTLLYLQPPAAAGARAKLEAPRPGSSYTPSSTTVLPQVRKTEEAPAEPVGTTGGVIGGLPGDAIGAIPDGVVAAAADAPRSMPLPTKPPQVAPAKRMRIAARVAEANLIHDVPPQYPSEAGRTRIEGTVILMAVIGKDGTVKDVRVESGLPILAQAAIDAVKQWRYKPYLIDGEPVEVDSRITINFTLSAS